MNTEQSYNLKNSLSAISILISVISVRLVDQYIYELKTWIWAIVAILLTLILYKLIDSIPKLDKEISKTTKMTFNILTIVILIVIFYTFSL